MTVFILAAGMGSRYGGLKQIDPFTENGEFIIDFSVYDAIQAGFDRVVFVIKEENYETFHETIGKRIAGKIKVEYVFQKMDYLVPADKSPADRVKPWGTTHALLCGKEVLNDGFIVINADDFYGRDAFFKAAEFLKKVENDPDNRHYCMVGYLMGNTLTDNGSVARGVCEVKDGKLTKIVERTKLFKEEGGAYVEENGETRFRRYRRIHELLELHAILLQGCGRGFRKVHQRSEPRTAQERMPAAEYGLHHDGKGTMRRRSSHHHLQVVRRHLFRR